MKALDLGIHIIYEGITESLLVPCGEVSGPALEELRAEHLAHGDPAPRGGGGVAWADATFRGTNGVGAQLRLLGLVDSAVEIKVDVASVGYEDAIVDVLQALLLDGLQFREEGGHVDDDTGSDEVHAVGVHEAGGQEVEVVADAIRDDRGRRCDLPIATALVMSATSW